MAISDVGKQMFARVVVTIGGEVLPGFDDHRCADFLFRQENIIVEMKVLDQQARDKHAMKMEALVNTWTHRGLPAVNGGVPVEVPKLSPQCQQEWFDVLESSAKNLVRHANRQIRATKQRLGLQNAKGVLLIGNEGNLLHASPADYMTLVLRMLANEKQAAHEPGFFHVEAAVYFSLEIPADPQVLPFWATGQVDTEGKQMLAFLAELRNGWFASLGKVRCANEPAVVP